MTYSTDITPGADEQPFRCFATPSTTSRLAIGCVASDYANALPRLKVGGVLVSDDVSLAPHLRRIWDTVIKRDPRYVAWEFAEGMVGVFAAVRMADEPVLPSLF